MANILSISYDASLLWTRQLMLQQLGHNVVSAEGFVAALEAAEAPNVEFDIAILGLDSRERQRANHYPLQAALQIANISFAETSRSSSAGGRPIH